MGIRREYPTGTRMSFKYSSPLDIRRVTDKYMRVGYGTEKRNIVMFDNEKTDFKIFFYLAKSRLGFWLKSWCPKCPYSPGDVVRNISLSPPPPKAWKWNVDGSAEGKH
ncbi:hypothetical protein MTR_3g010420 [Medicago truncatula]|uniref:Uncharacterized protein n=1 Tax=Medicago truncatula TaxID=3880 RepID=G7IVE6_MEDTR|nr:hypothetical protein MTR_3g010420 [Medicago truncatula]